jgi:zinc protease
MRKRTLLFVVCLVSASVFAQKETPLPPDLPPYGAEIPLKAPLVGTSKLENGLTVWLVAEPGFPKVSFSVAVRGGMAADPADRPGISQLLSKTLDQGTKSRSARKLAETIQAAGGDLSVDVSKDSVEVSTSVLSSKADDALGVLADVLTNATFPDDEVALAKRNLADSLRQDESEPSFLASRAMAKVLFGDHPYRVTAPTQESIGAASAAELRRIYGERFRPDQAVLVAVGDFQPERMLSLIRGKLNGWKSGTGPISSPTARVTSSAKPGAYVVDRPGSVQTTIQFGAIGPSRKDPDYAAAEVANAIYGGLFGSRLVSNIREDKGYTYSPFAAVHTYLAAGVLVTRADVRNEVTAPSLNEIMYEMNRMATTSPTAEEMSKARRYLVGVESIELQGRSAVARELATLWIEGLPPGEIADYAKSVSAATVSDVDAAAKKYFPANRSVVVAVGEEKVVRDALGVFGVSAQTAP